MKPLNGKLLHDLKLEYGIALTFIDLTLLSSAFLLRYGAGLGCGPVEAARTPRATASIVSSDMADMPVVLIAGDLIPTP
jgi:hypothetical protein